MYKIVSRMMMLKIALMMMINLDSKHVASDFDDDGVKIVNRLDPTQLSTTCNFLIGRITTTPG